MSILRSTNKIFEIDNNIETKDEIKELNDIAFK